jgi:deoxyribonuclease V
MSVNTQANTWNVTPTEARQLQEGLREEVNLAPLSQPPRLIAGADISFNKYEATVYAGFIILDIETLQPQAHSLAITEIHFPYIPGLLSFREIPALLEAWNQIPVKPDLVMVDGHGIAHPRRLGIATHFGLASGVPTIGVAKKKLVGNYTEPELTAGSYTELTHHNETIGYVYRSKNKVKPLYISPGNRTSLNDVLNLIRQTSGKYRLPEPTRQAHLLVNQLRRAEIKPGYKEYFSK